MAKAMFYAVTFLGLLGCSQQAFEGYGTIPLAACHVVPFEEGVDPGLSTALREFQI
jgi:hypothetical protein